MPHLETAEVALVHFNFLTMIINMIQESCIHLFLFFGLLLDNLETFNSEFSSIEVWFTDQNSKALEIEVKVNITLVIS